MNNAEIARRTMLRALAKHTEAVTLTDTDPQDRDPDPGKVSAQPTKLFTRDLASVGLLNQQQVELFRAELRTCLPLVDGELMAAKMSPGTVMGPLRDFITAALDLKA